MHLIGRPSRKLDPRPRAAVLALALALASPGGASGPEAGAEAPAPPTTPTPAPSPGPTPTPPPVGEDVFSYQTLIEELARRTGSATPAPAAASPSPSPAPTPAARPSRQGRGPAESPAPPSATAPSARHLFVEAGALFHAPRAAAGDGAPLPWAGRSDGETRPWAGLTLSRRNAWASFDGQAPVVSWRRIEWEARVAFAGGGRGESGAIAPGGGGAVLETEAWWPLGTTQWSPTVLGTLGPGLLYTALADDQVEGLRDSIGLGLSLNLVLRPPHDIGRPPDRLTAIAVSILAAGREEPEEPGAPADPADPWPQERRWTPLVRLLAREPVGRVGALVLDTRFAPTADFGAWSFSAAWSLPLPVVLGD